MERPILFSTPMVQAILDGRKTQTRRIVKMPDLIEHPDWFRYIGNSNDMEITRKAIPYDDRLYHEWQRVNSNEVSWVIHSHKPKDILWVRETWGLQRNDWPEEADTPFYCYKADDETYLPKWKPSIFMPKAACRIKLKIINIRVEKLQDITEEDAIAEGIGYGFQMNAGWPDYQHIENGVCELTQDSAGMSYASLWESINGKGSWEKNPWVWCLIFKKL